MEQDTKSRRWRYGVAGLAGGLLISLAAAYHFDLLERDPYPVLRSELQVDDVNTNLLLPRFQWLDDHRLVVVAFDHHKPMPNGRSHQMDALVVWDIATNTTTKVVEPDVGGLCVLDGQVLYFKRQIDPTGATSRDSQRRIHYRGPIGKGEPIPFKEPTDPKTCAPKSDRSGLPEWTSTVRDPAINVRRLRPEHGFLVIDRDSPTDWPRSIRLYRPGEGKEQGVDVTHLLVGPPQRYAVGIDPEFFVFSGAYYISLIAPGIPAWWLYPDGRLDRLWTVSKGGFPFKPPTGMGAVIPTRVFPITSANGPVQGAHSDNGLYSLEDFKNPRRLVRGRIGQELEVSPNGCKVAYANDDRRHIDRDVPRHVFKLQVITLCPEKQP